MNTQHTPGPWNVIPGSFDIIAKPSLGLRGRFIAEAIESTVLNEFNGPYVQEDLEREANARLIAAAPELLGTCQRLLRAIEWSKTEDRMTQGEKAAMLATVISHATGQDS